MCKESSHVVEGQHVPEQMEGVEVRIIGSQNGPPSPAVPDFVKIHSKVPYEVDEAVALRAVLSLEA